MALGRSDTDPRARGGSTLFSRSVRSKRGHRASRVVCSLRTLPSAVLMTLRIAEGRYGTREVILQDLASNALKGNVLS